MEHGIARLFYPQTAAFSPTLNGNPERHAKGPTALNGASSDEVSAVFRVVVGDSKTQEVMNRFQRRSVAEPRS